MATWAVTEGSRKAILAAFFANLGIAIAKFVGFLITGSAGLLAEAVHSLADTGNQAAAAARRQAGRARPPTREHPFGYGRERYFWAFVVALVLFSMGGLFALYEGIEKLRHPHEVENLRSPSASCCSPSCSRRSRCARRTRRPATSSAPTCRGCDWIRSSKQPELPVVLLEDTGAVIGLFFALVGVLLAHFTDEPRWDAVGSIAIGVLLVVIAIVLAIEMKGLLIGESASDGRRRPDRRDASRARRRCAASSTCAPSTSDPTSCSSRAKLEFDPTLTVEQLADAIDGAERTLRAAVPTAHLIYIEPDVYRPRRPTP